MDLSPKAISSATFPLARKGYDQEQVRTFLARVARSVEELQTRALQAEARSRLQEPGAPTPTPAPPGEPGRYDEVGRVLAMAQRTADATVAEARTEADGIRTQAEERAETLMAEARVRADNLVAAAEAQATRTAEQITAKGRAEAESLEQRRQALLDDISRLGAHMGGQRERIAATIDVLKRALEHPDGLQVSPLPELTAEPATLPPPGVVDVPPAPPSGPPIEAPEAAGGPDTGPVDLAEAGAVDVAPDPAVPADATPAGGVPGRDDTDAWRRFFGDQPASDDRWKR